MLVEWHSELKLYLEDLLGVSNDALHIHLGILIFLVFVLAMRRHPRRFSFALFGLLVICLVNEALDIQFQIENWRPVRWDESIKDVLGTLFWPVVMSVGRTTLLRLGGWQLVPYWPEPRVESLRPPYDQGLNPALVRRRRRRRRRFRFF